VEQELLAIANPRRRAMLELVADRERSSSELADLTGLSRPATSQHLKVLGDAGLVEARAAGNLRLYRARADRLEDLRAALEDFWSRRLGRLREEAEDG